MARKNTRSNDNPDTSLAAPQTRKERFLAKAAGLVAQAPIGQYNRLERYLQAIIERLDAGFYPSEAQLAAINSGATEAKINAIETKLPQYGMGKNLLRNSYFVGGGSQKGYGTFPINQRGGWVLVEGGYYFDSMWEGRHVSDGYYTAVQKGNNSWTVEIDGVTYYATNSAENIAIVPGYIGSSYYGIDGWKNWSKVQLTLDDGGMYIFKQKSPYQQFDPKISNYLDGKTLTASILTSRGLGYRTFTWHKDANSTTITTYGLNAEGSGAEIYVGGKNTGYNYNFPHFGVRIASGYEPDKLLIIAAKLELGDHQTLAHQENGVWVPNEVPDYGEELRRCQEWYYRIAVNAYDVFANGFITNSSNRASFIINFPVTMGRTPTPVYSGEFGINSTQFGSATYDTTLASNTRANIYFTANYNVPQGMGASLQDNGNGNAVIAFSAEP